VSVGGGSVASQLKPRDHPVCCAEAAIEINGDANTVVKLVQGRCRLRWPRGRH
jgi:hypothetical protein